MWRERWQKTNGQKIKTCKKLKGIDKLGGPNIVLGRPDHEKTKLGY